MPARSSTREDLGNRLQVTALPQRQSLVAHVVQQLSQQIQSGAAAPGARLPAENELCEMFDVSRTVVREAVSQLKAEELVQSMPGLGLYVARRPPGQGVLRLRAPAGSRLQNASELLEFRAGLEAEAARLAAHRRTPEDLNAMTRALAQLDNAEAHDSNGGAEDLDFHIAIACASKNTYILQVLQFLSTSIRDAISHSRKIRDPGTRAIQFEAARNEHKVIVEAIAASNADAAMALMQRHLATGQLRLLSGAIPADEAASDQDPHEAPERPV